MGEKNGKTKMNSYLIFCILHPGHLPSVCLWSAESGEGGGEEHTAQVMTGPYHQPTKQEKIRRTSSSWKNAKNTNTKYQP